MDFEEEGTNENPELKEIKLQSGPKITSTNIPPVADAGSDQSAKYRYYPPMLQFVFFNGSNSFDPDGVIVDYTWDFGDGTSSTGKTTMHTYHSLGNFTVTLQVTDNDGATDYDTAIITVIEALVGSIFTNKYSYNISEPINITYGGPHGDPGWWAAPYPVDLHFIIKNEDNETVVEEPFLLEIGMTVFWNWGGTVNWEWNQTYRLYHDYNTPDNLISPSGQQVPPGKYYVWFDTHSSWGLIGPAEFEIINSTDNSIEPLKITTDKYTYYLGEPVHITITGDRVGPSSDFHRGYLIKDEYGHWVRDAPQLHSTDIHHSRGPDNYTWHQKYELLYEYDIFGNHKIHFLNNSEQVSTGKYYLYPYPGNCEPAEIEIIERPELIIEKEKISGPDEIVTHTYHEWELKITVSGASPTKSYENVVVYDVLPAELTLLEFELTQGTLTETKKGKGKMGATHLLWDVGNLENEAELIIKIAARKNPAGKQEFTSPGTYFLNEGAWLKCFDNSTQENIEKGPTDPILVVVLKD
jgi:PKD repeat protein